MPLSRNIQRPRQKGLNLIELLMAIAAVSMMAMVGLPVFFDYVMRARLSDDISRVSALKLRVVEYHLLTGNLPVSNADIGMPPDLAEPGKYLSMFYVDGEPVEGTIKLVFDSVEALPSLGEENELWFEPAVVNDRLVWTCKGGNLAQKFRPASCRTDLGE